MQSRADSPKAHRSRHPISHAILATKVGANRLTSDEDSKEPSHGYIQGRLGQPKVFSEMTRFCVSDIGLVQGVKQEQQA
jgi:hypothetical protein